MGFFFLYFFLLDGRGGWQHVNEENLVLHFVTFTFTFMHLADAFIQSDLHCIQVTVLHLISSCFPWETNP